MHGFIDKSVLGLVSAYSVMHNVYNVPNCACFAVVRN